MAMIITHFISHKTLKKDKIIKIIDRLFDIFQNKAIYANDAICPSESDEGGKKTTTKNAFKIHALPAGGR